MLEGTRALRGARKETRGGLPDQQGCAEVADSPRIARSMGDGEGGAEEREKGVRGDGKGGAGARAESGDSGSRGDSKTARGARGRRLGQAQLAVRVALAVVAETAAASRGAAGEAPAGRGAAQLAQGGNGAGRAPRARAVLPWSCPRSGSKRSTGT